MKVTSHEEGAQIRAIERVRIDNAFAKALADARDAIRRLEPSRERSLVETKLDEAEMWFTKVKP